MSNPVLYLYGRETCHLCHDMWADVRIYLTQNQFNYELIWVDIDDASKWQALYAQRIPVLTNEVHTVLCEGRWDTAAFIQKI